VIELVGFSLESFFESQVMLDTQVQEVARIQFRCGRVEAPLRKVKEGSGGTMNYDYIEDKT